MEREVALRLVQLRMRMASEILLAIQEQGTVANVIDKVSQIVIQLEHLRLCKTAAAIHNL